MSEFLRRLHYLLHARQRNQELKDEMEFHRAMMPEPDRRHFGNRERLREVSHEVWGWTWLERLSQDLRYALRRSCKTLGFSVTVILTLALGIGANLAIFQLLQGLLFTQLPVAKPQELYALHAVKSPFDEQWFYSFAAYQRLKQATGDRAPVIARSGVGSGILQLNGDIPQEATLQLVSANFFPVLGLSPASGRFFEPGDDTTAASEVPVILRYDFARNKFGSTRSLVGRKAVFNRVPVVIIGIAPERFSGVVQGVAPDIWLPLSAQSTGRFFTWFDSLGPGYNIDLQSPYKNQEGIFWLWVLARVPGNAFHGNADTNPAGLWTQAIQPDLQLIAAANKDAHEREHLLRAQVQLVSAASGEGAMGEEYRKPLYLLMGMATMFFLVGCLNLGNLQLARLSARQREIGVRIALGASRTRVLRQLIVEDLVLLAIGAVLALATCRAASALLLHWVSGRERLMPIDLRISSSFFLVGIGLLVLAQLGFSILPAWRITRRHPGMTIRSSVGNIGGQGRRDGRWAIALLTGQVSLSLLLLCMAALFARTLLNLGALDAGLDRAHVLTVHLDLESGGLDKQDLTVLNRRILERLKSLPFVRDAAMQMCKVPNCVWNTAMHVSGRPDLSESQMHGEENHVSIDYFHTLGIPLLQGRTFQSTDQPHTQEVVILNQTFAQRLFGNADPIGHSLGYETAPGDHRFLVVGVVADAHVDGLRMPAPPVAYFSLEQGASAAGNIEVSILGSPSAAAEAIRRALLSVDPQLPIAEIVPLETEFNDGLSTEKLLARLTATFAAMTLALAGIGFYGLLSFQVVRRTPEIGIRMALGATRGQVTGLFLRQTLLILVCGILPGIVLTVLVGRSARTLLYGVRETDPLAVMAACAVLIVGGLAATVLPARRASALDPVKTLRAE
jgi:predicted permease